MIHLEFSVPGVPRSPRADSRGQWQTRIRDAAQRQMSDDWVTMASPVGIVIIYFHRGQASGIDVDNMSKPILDALKDIVYEDDQLVEQLIARRTELHDNMRFQKVTPRLAEALETEGGFVLVRVEDAPNHGELP